MIGRVSAGLIVRMSFILPANGRQTAFNHIAQQSWGCLRNHHAVNILD